MDSVFRNFILFDRWAEKCVFCFISGLPLIKQLRKIDLTAVSLRSRLIIVLSD